MMASSKAYKQKARVVVQKLRARSVQPPADGIEHVAGLLLERQQRPVADEEADLFEVELALEELNHPGNHEQPGGLPAVRARWPFPVRLNFRALGDVEHVFERQRMELIFLGDGLKHRHVGEAVHVDPTHGRPLGTMFRDEGGDVLDHVRLDMTDGVVDDGDLDAARLRRERRELGVLDSGGGARPALRQLRETKAKRRACKYTRLVAEIRAGLLTRHGGSGRGDGGRPKYPGTSGTSIIAARVGLLAAEMAAAASH